MKVKTVHVTALACHQRKISPCAEDVRNEDSLKHEDNLKYEDDLTMKMT